jgi:hypothetical protein
MTEFCSRFGTSPARRSILRGFLKFRADSYVRGISGFQWIGGSFVEDIERLESRSPKDIDVVTFVSVPNTPAAVRAAQVGPPDLLNRAYVKATYSVDHFWVPLSSDPAKIVSQARYWYGLFSHRRTRIWKGILIVCLVNGADEMSANSALAGTP